MRCGFGHNSGLPYYETGKMFDAINGCYTCSFVDYKCRMNCWETNKKCPKRSSGLLNFNLLLCDHNCVFRTNGNLSTVIAKM